MKKLISVLLAAAVSVSMMLSCPASAVNTELNSNSVMQDVGASSGNCGDNVRWTFSGSKLTISGTGKMTTYTALRQIPWYFMREKIYELEIGEGVTSIGASAFLGLTNIRSVTIPSTVKTLERSCFESCSGLTTVDVPSNVENIYSAAFKNCGSLRTIYIRNPQCSIGGTGETICNLATDSSISYYGVIVGYSGSYAENYASSYKKNFQSLGAAPVTMTTTSTTTATTTTTTKPRTTTTTSRPTTTTTKRTTRLTD